MQLVGEAADWFTALAQVPGTHPDMLLVEWDLVAVVPGAMLAQLRRACTNPVVIVLISHLEARQQAALSAGADAFINRGEMPDRVVELLRAAAANVHSEQHRPQI